MTNQSFMIRNECLVRVKVAKFRLRSLMDFIKANSHKGYYVAL